MSPEIPANFEELDLTIKLFLLPFQVMVRQVLTPGEQDLMLLCRQ
jgi:hypothetical protein